MTSAIWSNVRSVIRSRTPLGEVLHDLPLFARLSRKELAEVERIVHLRTYRAGEVIFNMGDTGVAMYVILAGEVCITLPERDTKQTIELARLGPGDLFGELALLDSTPRSATAIAVTPTEAAAIARPDWIDLIHRRPTIGVGMLLPLGQLLSARLRVANRIQAEQTSPHEKE